MLAPFRRPWGCALAVAVTVALLPGAVRGQGTTPTGPPVSDVDRARALAEEAIRKSEEAQALARDVARATEAIRLANEAKRLAEEAARLIRSAAPAAAAPASPPAPAPPSTQRPVAAQAPPPARPPAPEAPRPKAPPRPESLSFGFNYRVRGWLRGNLDLDKRTGGDNEDAFIDHRPRIQIDAGYRPFDFRLLLEKGDSIRDFRKVNPERESSVMEKWGSDTLVPTNVRWAYLTYTGPVVVRAGRQLVELGHAITLQGDMDTLRADKAFTVPGFGSIAGSLAYSKFPFVSEGAGNLDDTDMDAWMAAFDVRPFRLVKGVKFRPYLYKVVDLSRRRSTSRALDLNLDRDANPGTHSRDGSLEPLWAGMAVDGRAGDLEWWLEAVKVAGPFSATRDFDAHAGVGHASYKIDRYTLRLSAAWGSGAGGRGAAAESGDFDEFLGAFVCKDRFHYGNLFSRDINGGFGLFQSNLANITVIRPQLDVAVTPEFTLGFSYSFLRTTESVYEGVGPQGLFGAPVSRKRTNDVGHDFGLEASYRIARPATGFLRFGYFLPGAVYRLPGGRSADPAFELIIGTEFNLGVKVF